MNHTTVMLYMGCECTSVIRLVGEVYAGEHINTLQV